MFIPILVIAWLFVVLMASVAEAVAPNGTVLGAIFTFVGWGVFPLSIVVYLLSTPMRRNARALRELAAEQANTDTSEATEATQKIGE